VTTFDASGPRPLPPSGFHPIPGTGVPLGMPAAADVPRRSAAMRRRVLVFTGVFLLCAIVSLSYTFMRPAIYLADARVQVTPSGISPSVASSAARDGSQDFMVELQVLSSRPLLEKVVARLSGGQPPANVDEAVLSLQSTLSFRPVEGTNVVHIEARGPDRTAVARQVNAVIDVYREEQAASGNTAAEKQLADAREALRVMDERVAARKKVVEEFRVRSAIVSAERDENQTLARLKGLGTASATNDERLAAAEGRVRALEQAAASGKRSSLAKDNPTLANMEARLSQLREDYKGLERQYTQQYLDMDPLAKAARIRITNLEQQLDGERAKGQQNALAEAREEVAAARATAQKLQQQQAGDRQNVEAFTRRFSEFKTMEEDLKGLEQMRQTARQRAMALEATATERKPRLLVLEPAAVPEAAWRPLYARDAGISLAGSLALGFLAVWFVEFFNRTEPTVAASGPTVIFPQPWVQPYPTGPTLGAPSMMPPLGHGGGAPAAPVALIGQGLPRELDQREVHQLLAASAPEHLFVLVCLLCGLSADEVAALKVSDVDAASGNLKVPGEGARALPLQGPLMALQTSADTASKDSPLLPSAAGRALSAADIASAVTSSAFDAGLEQPQSVTPESLRHTYVAFLVRQGLRFGDLGRVVGRLSSETLNALAPLAPPGERQPLSAVQRVMPAVAGLDAPAA
jgi:succinoglycan biosynthesis transport protein ExoP